MLKNSPLRFPRTATLDVYSKQFPVKKPLIMKSISSINNYNYELEKLVLYLKDMNAPTILYVFSFS